jgi:hypothetical protein
MDTSAPHIRTVLPSSIKLALLPPVLFVGGFGLAVLGLMSWSLGIFELGELVWYAGGLLAFVGLPIGIWAARSRHAADHRLAIWIGLLGNILVAPLGVLMLRHLVEQWLLHGPVWPI